MARGQGVSSLGVLDASVSGCCCHGAGCCVSTHCRRGYRSDSAVHKAALNEAAAAGLLLLAGWQDTCQQEGKQGVLLCSVCGVKNARVWDTHSNGHTSSQFCAALISSEALRLLVYVCGAVPGMELY